MANREQILIAGVEGGGVTLYRVRFETGWRFEVEYSDQTGAYLDKDEAEPEIRRTTGELKDWKSALAALDRERWYRMPCIMVHPDFRERVWAAVRGRLESGSGEPDKMTARLLDRWRERCRA